MEPLDLVRWMSDNMNQLAEWGRVDVLERILQGAVHTVPTDEAVHLDLGILVKKKAQANIRDAATGRLFLVVFLLCE